MLPATLFRQVRQHSNGLFKGQPTNQLRNWEIAMVRLYADSRNQFTKRLWRRIIEEWPRVVRRKTKNVAGEDFSGLNRHDLSAPVNGFFLEMNKWRSCGVETRDRLQTILRERVMGGKMENITSGDSSGVNLEVPVTGSFMDISKWPNRSVATRDRLQTILRERVMVGMMKDLTGECSSGFNRANRKEPFTRSFMDSNKWRNRSLATRDRLHTILRERLMEYQTGESSSGFNRFDRVWLQTALRFPDIEKLRHWDVATSLQYILASKHLLQMPTLNWCDLQPIIEKNRAIFIEFNNMLVDQIRKASSKIVREEMPNLLTVSKALLTLYIWYVYLQGDFGLALSLMIVAVIRDLLDGNLGRRKPKSKSGTCLEPVVDKLLLTSLIILMGSVIGSPNPAILRDAFLFCAGFVILPPKTPMQCFDAKKVFAQWDPIFISNVIQLANIGFISYLRAACDKSTTHE